MFQTWVFLLAFYVALKMGWQVLAPVVVAHGSGIVIGTALYFAAGWWIRYLGMRHLAGSRSAVYEWLRDSSLFTALMAYFAGGFFVGSVYLLATQHASLAGLFAILGIGLAGSIVGMWSRNPEKREG